MMAGRRKNVLFVSLEDANPWFGCYGHHQVSTPNIDEIASRGTVFRHAYSQAAVCNPSRASLIMGLRPETTGVYGNYDEWRDRIPEATGTIPEHFRANGYRTVNIGKVVHSGERYRPTAPEGAARVEAMWETHLPNPEGDEPILEPKRPAAPAPDEFREWDGIEFVESSLNWGSTGLDAEQHADTRRARAAAQCLREHVASDDARPLFLSIGFASAHYSFRPPAEFAARYSAETTTLPHYPPGDLDDVPVVYPPFNTTDGRRMTNEETKQLIAAYQACIGYVDFCVGVLTAALEAAGVADETVVCIWTDHGLHMGEHGLWRKETLFEEASHVPLIIADPDREPAVTNRLVELVDVYPTLCDVCDLPTPDGLEGTSAAPLMDDPNRPWKKAVFTHVRRGTHNVTARTEEWRYSEWGDSRRRELYDLVNDPLEITNLAYDPAYAEARREMQGVLAAGWRGAVPG
jgi:arylsulfatase A-like enzyme